MTFGPSESPAEIALKLPGDLAHALASGTLLLEDAILDPELQWTSQSPAKVRGLIDLPASLKPFYLQALETTGCASLVPTARPPVFTSEQDLYESLGVVPVACRPA